MTKRRTWSAYGMPSVRDLILQDRLYEAGRFSSLVETGRRPPGWDDALIQLRMRDFRSVERLRDAELFWVTEAMATAAMDGSTDIPDFAPRIEMPSMAGVMGFEKSLPPVAPAGPLGLADGTTSSKPRPVDILTWYADEDELSLSAWTRRENWGPGPRTGTAIPFDLLVAVRMSLLGSLDMADLDATHRALISFLGSAWVMMQTPTVTTPKRVPVSTPSAQRAKKAGNPSDVVLLDLRPLPHTDNDGSSTSTGREHTHRWIVRGHWRNQAHGPRLTQRRLVWVPSYVKGPRDAPFKGTERVMVWRR